MKAVNNIEVQINTTSEPLPTVADFTQWVNLVLINQKKNGTVTIRLVDTKESQMLNKTYRHKDKPTNVLSFPFENFESFTVSEAILGDLVLCAPIVLAEASEQKKPLLAHWAHLTIHGTLHLLGYDHIMDTEAENMEALEVMLLQQLGYANPYE
jgi:probable rRNA maturation factor